MAFQIHVAEIFAWFFAAWLEGSPFSASCELLLVRVAGDRADARGLWTGVPSEPRTRVRGHGTRACCCFRRDHIGSFGLQSESRSIKTPCEEIVRDSVTPTGRRSLTVKTLGRIRLTHPSDFCQTYASLSPGERPHGPSCSTATGRRPDSF